MVVQVVNLEVLAESVDIFLKEAIANAQASLRESGVVQFDLLQQSDNPLKFILYEVYQSMEDIEIHRHTPHFKRWVEVGIPTLSSERVRTLYQKINLESFQNT